MPKNHPSPLVYWSYHTLRMLAYCMLTLRFHLAFLDLLPDQHVLLHQVDANPLNAAAKSGNKELVQWLADECGVTHVYNKVSISQKLHF